jgi:hypothetical protein
MQQNNKLMDEYFTETLKKLEIVTVSHAKREVITVLYML